MLTGDDAVGRVIARPFEGSPGAYARTPRRHDFSLEPPTPNHLQLLRQAGVGVHAVGKIGDIFAGRDIDSSAPTESNAEGIVRTIERLRDLPDGSIVFTNLVETDMIWGHRNDPEGFAGSLQEFDEELPRLLAALRHGDLLVITSDHGCDPTTASTDHSREHGLLLAHVPGLPAMGRRHDGDTFADVGATVFGHVTGRPAPELPGRSIFHT
jgi:phosphopentomutase